MKNVLFISRSIEPPWDEASRNFVRSIALNLNGYNKYVMTGSDGSSIDRADVFDSKIYTKREWGIFQKIRLARALFSIRRKFDIYHFCFTPEKISSRYIKSIMPPGKGMLRVQTIPYIPDWALNDPGKVVFGDYITVFSEMTRYMLERSGIKNVYLAYPPVDAGLYYPQDRKDEARTALYAGYLPREKVANDIYTIIEAVLDQKRDVEFILAVRTKNPREVSLKKRLYTKLRARFEKRIHFIENSSQIVSAIRECDVLVYPFFEGFERKIDIPFVIAEAMSCAKAVLVSDIAPLNEPFKKMGGMLTKAKNAEDFALELAALCSDEETLKSAGNANKAIADSLFNIKNNMGVIETIYSRAGNG